MFMMCLWLLVDVSVDWIDGFDRLLIILFDNIYDDEISNITSSELRRAPTQFGTMIIAVFPHASRRRITFFISIND